MFPLRDHNPSGRTPYVTWILMAINVVVYLSYVFRLTDPEALHEFYRTWGMQPAELMEGREWHTLITCMFLHGGWLHIGGNMMFLFIFGDNVEDALGHLWYLLFYLVCGVGAGAIHLASDPESLVPTVGASGAVAGVMGAYLLFYPKAKVDILVFLVVIVQLITAPAWLLLGAWFALESYRAMVNSAADGIAHWAHSGGLALGLLCAIPVFWKRGGPAMWRLTRGLPPHPPAPPPRIVDALDADS